MFESFAFPFVFSRHLDLTYVKKRRVVRIHHLNRMGYGLEDLVDHLPVDCIDLHNSRAAFCVWGK